MVKKNIWWSMKFWWFGSHEWVIKLIFINLPRNFNPRLVAQKYSPNEGFWPSFGFSLRNSFLSSGTFFDFSQFMPFKLFRTSLKNFKIVKIIWSKFIICSCLKSWFEFDFGFTDIDGENLSKIKNIGQISYTMKPHSQFCFTEPKEMCRPSCILDMCINLCLLLWSLCCLLPTNWVWPPWVIYILELGIEKNSRIYNFPYFVFSFIYTTKAY